jgi:anti-sigma factor ChrR (cupin superfamily)
VKILAPVYGTDSFCSPDGRDMRHEGKGKPMGLLHRSLNDILRIDLNVVALDELQWRDFGKGLSMSRLAREGKRELILYRIAANAASDPFLKHEHIGGEFYLVLRGKIADETGEYVEGDLVFLDPQSVHTPRAVGDTVVLVLWPEGVRIVD